MNLQGKLILFFTQNNVEGQIEEFVAKEDYSRDILVDENPQQNPEKIHHLAATAAG